MKRYSFVLATLFMALLFVGAGCISGSSAPSGPSEPQADVDDVTPSHIGTWARQALFVDGQAQDAVPATIEFSADSYVSSTFCTASGNLVIEGENITMSLANTDCPTGAIPNVYHSRLVLSEDGEHLTLINTEFGAEVREEYARQ